MKIPPDIIHLGTAHLSLRLFLRRVRFVGGRAILDSHWPKQKPFSFPVPLCFLPPSLLPPPQRVHSLLAREIDTWHGMGRGEEEPTSEARNCLARHA